MYALKTQLCARTYLLSYLTTSERQKSLPIFLCPVRLAGFWGRNHGTARGPRRAMPRREAPAHALPPDFEGLIDLLVAKGDFSRFTEMMRSRKLKALTANFDAFHHETAAEAK